MECFWGVEVNPGQALICESFKNDVINLTQVALGETTLRRDNERVYVYLHVDKKIIVLGTLIHGRCHQIGLNLIFNKSFQISHSSKYASLFFCGYSRVVPKWKQSVRRDDEGDDKDFEDFCSSDDGNEKDEDEDDYDDDDDYDNDDDYDDDDDNKDEGTPMDSDTETPRIIKKGNVSTSEDDSNDEEEEYDKDEDMEDSRSDDKDEESEDEVDSSEDDEDEERVAMMFAGNHKRPRPNSGIKNPKTNKKAKVVTPHVEKPGKGKKCVQFSTHYDGASKGAKKGKRTTGGSRQQSLASKKTPKSSSTPWPGKKGHSVAKQAKGS